MSVLVTIEACILISGREGERERKGEGSFGTDQVANSGRQGQSCSSCRPLLGPAWSQYYGVLQTVQCQDPEGRGQYYPRHHYRLQGSYLQLHHEDAPGFRSPEEGRRHHQGDRKSTRLNSSHHSISYA